MITYNNANFSEHLLHNPEFDMAGSETYTRYRILENRKAVGIIYLSYMDIEENIRMKYYYKFVCQKTSAGVSNTIGSHIYDVFILPG